MAPPLGELSPKVTERGYCTLVYPLRPRFAQPPLPKGEARGAVHYPTVPVNCLIRPAHLRGAFFTGFREFDRIRRGKLLGNGQISENSQHWIFIQISR